MHATDGLAGTDWKIEDKNVLADGVVLFINEDLPVDCSGNFADNV